jgi:three-Cys-motif partner protein
MDRAQTEGCAPLPEPFRRLYIDAFAGTGSRTDRRLVAQPLLDLPELEAVTKGSARLALEIEPPFDEYILIEKATRRAGELKQLRDTHPKSNHHDSQ